MLPFARIIYDTVELRWTRNRSDGSKRNSLTTRTAFSDASNSSASGEQLSVSTSGLPDFMKRTRWHCTTTRSGCTDRPASTAGSRSGHQRTALQRDHVVSLRLSRRRSQFILLLHSFLLVRDPVPRQVLKRESPEINQSDDTGGENVWSVHATTPNVDLLLGIPKAGVLLRNVTCSKMRQNCSRKPSSTPQKGSTLSESRSPELM